MWLNIVNATCEAIGALLAWRSVALIRREAPQGVSKAMVAFSALWSVECLPYYLSHDDTLSAGFAAVRCAGLSTWSYFALKSGGIIRGSK